MIGKKYTRSHYDHCVCFQKLHDGSFIYFLLYVDDKLVACRSKVEIDKLKTQFRNEFEIVWIKYHNEEIKGEPR